MLIQLCVMERPGALACVPAVDPLADRACHPLDAGPRPERGLQWARTLRLAGGWLAGWRRILPGSLQAVPACYVGPLVEGGSGSAWPPTCSQQPAA